MITTYLTSKAWWQCAATRAVKTICQAAISLIGTCVFITDVSWVAVVSGSAIAGLLSLLTSLGGLPEIAFEYEDDE